VAIGDLDKDGYDDVVVVHTTPAVTVLLSKPIP